MRNFLIRWQVWPQLGTVAGFANTKLTDNAFQTSKLAASGLLLIRSTNNRFPSSMWVFPVRSTLLFTLNKEEQKIVDAIFFFGGGRILPLVITQVQMWLEIWQWHSKIYLVFGSIFLYRRMRNSCIINGWKETCRSHQSALFVTSHVDWSSGKVSFLKLILVFFTKSDNYCLCSLQDWRCLWCKSCVHFHCKSSFIQHCSLGETRSATVPPTSLIKIGGKNFIIVQIPKI